MGKWVYSPVIIDFHCHITTPHSRLPEAEGDYYRALSLPAPAGTLLGQWTQDAVDLAAERLRTPAALRAYRKFSPLIYTEMSPRLFAMLRLLAASDKSDLPVYLHTGNFPIYRRLETP